MAIFRATTPTRIDIAGGTVDIWPVCFSLDRPAVTVNLAIDLRTEVAVEATGDRFLEVESKDRDLRVRLPVEAIRHETLGLATRLAEWFGVGDGLRIETLSSVPPQSGLGGSSALAIALAGALGKLRGVEWDIATLQNIETALLRMPTGYQDYYPPFHGGLHALMATPGGVERERIDGGEEFLASHLLLVDTKLSHESGMNNWEVVKRFLDWDATTQRALNHICNCAWLARDALRKRDLDMLAAAVNDEWAERRRLAPVVSNEKIERIGTAARQAGALAGKVCGAGGGGCMVFLVRENPAPDVVAAVEQAGGAILDFRPDGRGLRTLTE